MKPCPFCDNVPIIDAKQKEIDNVFIIYCETCRLTIMDSDLQFLKKKWNTRTK